MIDKPIYIYTIPKAGTYFLANLLEVLGFVNTGWHISRYDYLSTRDYDMLTNKYSPSSTAHKICYQNQLVKLKKNHVAFGHLAPQGFEEKLGFLMAYRHPKEVLVSEFIDFRFRRKDVDFVSQSIIKDDRDAFYIYIKQHSQNNILKILKNFYNFQSSLMKSNIDYVSINFNNLIKDGDLQYYAMCKVLNYLNLQVDDPIDILKKAKSLDNKTKSKDLKLPFKREELWTDETLKLYNKFGFDKAYNNIIDIQY